MRGKLVAQITLLGGLCGRLHLRVKQTQLGLQQVDLLLLPIHGAIEFFDRILGQADLDFQFGQAFVHRWGFRVLVMVRRCKVTRSKRGRL